ncbi:MAG: hypothetical protein N2513_07050 [Deltaproteobacteria bacterium]|nr:hypothetical protein [Deltaproteobacteria bacterium]
MRISGETLRVGIKIQKDDTIARIFGFIKDWECIGYEIPANSATRLRRSPKLWELVISEKPKYNQGGRLPLKKEAEEASAIYARDVILPTFRFELMVNG